MQTQQQPIQQLAELEALVYDTPAQQYPHLLPSILDRLAEFPLNLHSQNKDNYIAFLRILIHTMCQLETGLTQGHLQRMVNILLGQCVGLKSVLPLDQQILGRFGYQHDETTQQLCISIIAYLVEQASQANAGECIKLVYFGVVSGLGLEKKTYTEFGRLLEGCLEGSRGPEKGGQEERELDVGYAKELIKQIFEGKKLQGHIVRVIGNLMVFVLRFSRMAGNVEWTQRNWELFSVICLTIQSETLQSLNKKDQNQYSRQREMLFVELSMLYSSTGLTVVLSMLRKIISNGVTITMVDSLYGLLNPDLGLINFYKQNLQRIGQIYDSLRNRNQRHEDYCALFRDSWLRKNIQKLPAVCYMDLHLGCFDCNNRDEDMLLFGVQGEKCTAIFYEAYSRQKTGQYDSKIYVRYTNSATRDGPTEKQVVMSCKCRLQFQIQFRDNEIWLYSDPKKIIKLNTGRPKVFFIGSDSDKTNTYINRIYNFHLLELKPYHMFYAQRQKYDRRMPELNAQRQKFVIKRLNSQNAQKKNDLKFDLIGDIKRGELFAVSNKKAIKQKVYDNMEIKLQSKRLYEIMQICKVRQTLIAFSLSAFEQLGNHNQNVLPHYIKLIKNQLAHFTLSKENQYQIIFVTESYIRGQWQQNSVINYLMEMVVSCKDYKNEAIAKFEEKQTHSIRMKMLLKMEILLSVLIKSGKNTHKQSINELLDFYLRYFPHKTDEVLVLIKQQLLKLFIDYGMIYRDNLVTDPISGLGCFLGLAPEMIKKIFFINRTVDKTCNATVDYLTLALLMVSCTNFKNVHLEIERETVYAIMETLTFILWVLVEDLLKTRNIQAQAQKKILGLINDLYLVLPTLVNLARTDEHDEKLTAETSAFELYDILQSKNRIYKHKSTELMSNFYSLCFWIGTYCNKENELGILAYFNSVINYVGRIHDKILGRDFQVSESDKKSRKKQCYENIIISELYLNCWAFLCSKTENKSNTYNLDRSKMKAAYNKLKNAVIPVYYPGIIMEQLIELFITDLQDYEFPSFLLVNVQKLHLKQIIDRLEKNVIDKIKNKSQKQRIRCKLMEIVLEYQGSLQHRFQQPLTESNSQSRLTYKWYKIYDSLKYAKQVLTTEGDSLENTINEEGIGLYKVVLGSVAFVQECLGDESMFAQVGFYVNLLKDRLNQLDNQDKKQDNEYFETIFQILFQQCARVNCLIFETKRYELKTNELKTNEPKNSPETNFLALELSLCEQQPARIIREILLKNKEHYVRQFQKISIKINLVLLAYCSLVEILDREQQLYLGRSVEYEGFQHYILDDYLSSEKIKLLLKKDIAAVVSSKFNRDVGTLHQKHREHIHKKLAIEIAKKLENLNRFPELQGMIEKLNMEKPKQKSGYIEALLVTKSKIYQGRLKVQDRCIKFRQNSTINNQKYLHVYANPSQQRTIQQISIARRELVIDAATIQTAKFKNYLQKYPALEVESKNFSYFFVFSSVKDRQRLADESQFMIELPFQTRESVNESESEWQNGWISNFQRLVTLNNSSGRSLNELSQYYVFPWTVTNFTDEMNSQFFFQDNFRDLKCSIGAVNPKKRNTMWSKYNDSRNSSSSDETSHIFGSFYSNSAIVTNYLLRVNPFTVHHYQLQGNSFDLPERLFTNLQDQYQSVYSQTSDNRQLVPEFYSAPEFFRNRNKYNFSHDPKCRNSLEMKFPQWVVTQSPEQFVIRMRKALESTIVSENLSSWVDLVFGVYSKYENALKYAQQHMNLFYSQLYTQNQEDLKTETGTFVERKYHMIKQFGQVPKCIFSEKAASLVKLDKNLDRNKKSFLGMEPKKLQIPEIAKCLRKQSRSQNFTFDIKSNTIAINIQSVFYFYNPMKPQIKPLFREDWEQCRNLSILPVEKVKYFLCFWTNNLGQLSITLISRFFKQRLILSRESYVFEDTIKGSSFLNARITHLKSVENYMIAVQQNTLIIFEVVAKQPRKFIVRLEKEFYLHIREQIKLHRTEIVHLETYEGLGLAVTVDQENIVNTLTLTPQVTIRGTFKLADLKPSESIIKILIHQTGVLVFLTSLQRLLVYNIYGDLIQRAILNVKGISDASFFKLEQSSEILLCNKVGELYQFDIFDLYKRGDDYLSNNRVNLPGNTKMVKVNDRPSNKILVNQFGHFWKIYLLTSCCEVLWFDNNYDKNITLKIIKDNINKNANYVNV